MEWPTRISYKSSQYASKCPIFKSVVLYKWQDSIILILRSINFSFLIFFKNGRYINESLKSLFLFFKRRLSIKYQLLKIRYIRKLIKLFHILFTILLINEIRTWLLHFHELLICGFSLLLSFNNYIL